MSDDARGPAAYASEIDQARERLAAFAEGLGDEQWHAAPLDGDPRSVGVVVDHVAHAYEYLGGWMRQILDGQAVTVSSDVPRSGPRSPPRPDPGPRDLPLM